MIPFSILRVSAHRQNRPLALRFLAFGVVLVVNLEIVAGSPFVGEILAEMVDGSPTRWVEEVWPSLRKSFNAAMLTFLALDAYVTVYHPDWVKGRADHGG